MNKREAFKNLILCFLIISTCVLTVLTWGFSGNLLSNNGRYIIISAFGKEIPFYLFTTEARSQRGENSPRIINLRSASIRQGESLYFVSESSLPTVISRAGDLFQRIDGGEFKKDTSEKYDNALKGEFLLFDFNNNLPFDLVYYFFNQEEKEPGFFYPVRYVLISPDSKKIFVKNSITDSVYSLHVSDLKLSISADSLGSPCVFLGDYIPEENESIKKTPYETAVETSQLKYSVLYSKNPFVNNDGIADTEIYGNLLRTFGVNPYTSSKYPDSEGAKIAVDNTSTIRLDNDGTVTFKVLNEEKGYLPEGGDAKEIAKSYSSMANQANALMTALSALSDGNVVETKLTSVSYSEQDGGYKFYFDYYYSKTRIVFSNRAAAAVILFKQGFVVSADIKLAYYSKGDYAYSLPIKQSMAALEGTALEGTAIYNIEKIYNHEDDAAPMMAAWAAQTEQR